MTQGRLLLVMAIMLLSLAALSAWYFMPIYPDEIAFRLQMGRYIPDRGVVYGLYPLCASNVKVTPLLFVIPASILSWLDLTFSPVAIRILPFISVIAAVFLTIWYAARGANPKTAVIATTAFIGVAGSGLVLARYEYVQILNIVCCLGVFHFLDSPSTRTSLRFGLFTLLLISSLLSLYAHVQGLLFLPLTLYLAYNLLSPKFGKLRAAFLMAMLLVFMAQTAISFHHGTCSGYPEIEQFWSQMTFNVDEFKSTKLTNWLTAKFDKYLQTFLYNGNYTVNYLPGINVEESWQLNLLGLLNNNIQIVLVVNLLLAVFITLASGIFTIKQYMAPRQLSATWRSTDLSHVMKVALALLILPVSFLFLYDSVQNFYRSFFLNLLISIVLALLLSRVSIARARSLIDPYSFFCGALVITSLATNVWCFTDKLRAGYEGPSLSLDRDWVGIERDVKALAKDCDMDMSAGRIVLDDLTYDSLKSYPQLYAATYMGLEADINKFTMSDVINKVRPNYAIARCDTLRGTSIGFQKSRNQLCCTNFIGTELTK